MRRFIWYRTWDLRWLGQFIDAEVIGETRTKYLIRISAVSESGYEYDAIKRVGKWRCWQEAA